MIRSKAIALTCCALALILFVACGGEKKSVPRPAGLDPKPEVNEPAKPAVSAPAGVPESLKAQVAKEWPEIEAKGKQFAAKFKEAQAAHAAGDRAKLSSIVDEANKIYNDFNDQWAVIYYSVDDLPEATAEKSRRWMRNYEKQVDAWTKMSKALKEFSSAK